MKEVSEFEARLLRILRCAMQKMTVEQALALLVKPMKRPKCLSRNCVELVQDGLSKGVTEWLARSGWANSRFLHNAAVVSGRLWGRHSPEALQLSFSKNSMELLIWLTAVNFAEPKSPANIDERTLTPGDRLLMLMTYAAIRSTLGGPSLLKQPGFEQHGLIGLMFPSDVAVVKGKKKEPDIAFWCQLEHCWVLEALQTELARQWFRIERGKRKASNGAEVKKIGKLQSKVLTALFAAARQSERKDLCLFLLSTGHHLLQSFDTEKWFDHLDVRHLRMADRASVYRAALAYFHGTEKLHEWNQQAQGVGFYDEDYQASQLWKSEWERLDGDRLVRASRKIIHDVDPVRTVAETP